MIHIQSVPDRNRADHFDAACAMFGALDSNLKPRFTSYEEVKSHKFDMTLRTDMYVGSVGFMREIFNRLGVDPRVPINTNVKPKYVVSIAEAKRILDEGKPYFVKPANTQKLFTGLVLHNSNFLNTYPDKELVLMYTPFDVKIKSESRVYVRNNKPVFVGNYAGDIWTFPDKEFVRGVIQDVCQPEKFPCCYTIDVAVMEDGTQRVVEFNDMWAIGNYGMANDLYFVMLKERYFEIIKKMT